MLLHLLHQPNPPGPRILAIPRFLPSHVILTILATLPTLPSPRFLHFLQFRKRRLPVWNLIIQTEMETKLTMIAPILAAHRVYHPEPRSIRSTRLIPVLRALGPLQYQVTFPIIMSLQPPTAKKLNTKEYFDCRHSIKVCEKWPISRYRD